MQRDVERVLIGRQAIAQRVAEVAKSITRDFNREWAVGDPPVLTLVPILTGSIIFVSDLIRQMPLHVQIRMISVSSYPGTSLTSKEAQLRSQFSSLPEGLKGARVLVIDDILDSGQTLRLVTGLLRDRQPATLHTCVLLRKQRAENVDFPVDYVCFDIPDGFVVGYGLDFNDYYRNLPDIVTLRPEVIRRHIAGRAGLVDQAGIPGGAEPVPEPGLGTEGGIGS